MKKQHEPKVSEMEKDKLVDVIAKKLGIPAGQTTNIYRRDLEKISEYFSLKSKPFYYKETIEDRPEAVDKELVKAMKLNNLHDTDSTPAKVEILKQYFHFLRNSDDIKDGYEKHLEEYRSKETHEIGE